MTEREALTQELDALRARQKAAHVQVQIKRGLLNTPDAPPDAAQQLEAARKAYWEAARALSAWLTTGGLRLAQITRDIVKNNGDLSHRESVI